MDGEVSHLVAVHVAVDVGVRCFLLVAKLAGFAIESNSAYEAECLVAGNLGTGINQVQVDLIGFGDVKNLIAPSGSNCALSDRFIDKDIVASLAEKIVGTKSAYDLIIASTPT